MTEENKNKKIELKKREKIHQEMVERQLIARKDAKIPPEGVCISFKNINKIYPNHKQAVFDFSLDIQENEFIVFVGPSGCGKSTTLRMLAGLEDITYGDLFIDGKYANDMMPKERDVAMVFQNYALYPNITVYDNMAFSLQARNYDKQEIDRRVRQAAKILEIEEYLDVKPANLSGGQRQRVALGRAITRNAKVFLMDEPLSNLDAKLRVQMRSEIVKLHNRVGATTIYVTHDQTEAMTMATRIVVMKDGYIQQIGTPKEIYHNPANVFVAKFIGSPAMNVLDCTVENGTLTLENNLKIPLTEKQNRRIADFYEQAMEDIRQKIANLEKEIQDRKYELTHPDYIRDVLAFDKNRSKLSAQIAKLKEKIQQVKKRNGKSATVEALEKELAEKTEAFAAYLAETEQNIRSTQYKEVVPRRYEKLLESDDYLGIYENDLQKLKLELAHYTAVRAGEKCGFRFGIRPEEIYSEEQTKDVSEKFCAKVTVAELMGHEYYIHFNVGATDVTAKLNTDQAISPDDELMLKVDLRYVHLFDTFSERCIF